jgi:hypothetical protein
LNSNRSLPTSTTLTTGALLVIFALAIWLRFQFIVIFGGFDGYLDWAIKYFYGGITPVYINLARDILEKGSYLSTAYPPGYPLFIAGLDAMGIVDLHYLRIAQIIIDSTGVFALFLLLRAAHAPKALSVIGGLLYAAHPLWAAGSTFILAEALSPAMMLWCLVALARAAKSSKTTSWIIAGFTIGIASLIRPDFLLLICIAGLWALLNGAKVGSRFAIVSLIIGFALPVGGWGVHNRIQHDVWLFSTTGGGVGLWEGLGAIPNEFGYILSDVEAGKMLQEKGLRWHSLEADKYLKQEYLRAWREHPEHVIKVILYRWENILFSSEKLESKTWSPLQKYLDNYGVWLVLIALFACWRNSVGLLLVATPVFYALFSIGLVHWEPRYVRYVHISYLSAALLLLSWYLQRNIVRKNDLFIVLNYIVILASVGLLLIPGFDKVIERRSQIDLAQQLPQKYEQGKLTLGPKLHELDWTEIGKATLKISDDKIDVLTNQASFDYQAAAVLNTNSIKAMLLTCTLAIESGGATIGILSESGEWLTQYSMSVPGTYQVQLPAGIHPNKKITLLLSNHNPNGASRFSVSDLRIHFSYR